MSLLLLTQAHAAQQGWLREWTPGIGDPTPLAWLAVALYFTAAAASFIVARRLQRAATKVAGRESHAWWSLCALLIALGANKQLDFQVPLKYIGKRLVRESGLYTHEQLIRIVFILAVILTCTAVAGLLLRWMRAAPRVAGVALTGIAIVLLFTVLRALRFYHLDGIALLQGNDEWAWLMELSGIVLSGTGAVLRARH